MGSEIRFAYLVDLETRTPPFSISLYLLFLPSRRTLFNTTTNEKSNNQNFVRSGLFIVVHRQL